MKLTKLFAVAALAVTFAAGDAFATCTAGGYYQQDPRFYNHIRNGVPNSPDSCWTKTSAVAVASSTSCGWTANAFEFNGYAQKIEQSFATNVLTSNNWSLDYNLDFIDPNNDAAWNKLEVRVYDQNNQLLATDYYDGGYADVTCTLRSISFTGTPTSVRVEFKGTRGYTNTYIRVRGIALWQGP